MTGPYKKTSQGSLRRLSFFEILLVLYLYLARITTIKGTPHLNHLRAKPSYPRAGSAGDCGGLSTVNLLLRCLSSAIVVRAAFDFLPNIAGDVAD